MVDANGFHRPVLRGDEHVAAQRERTALLEARYIWGDQNLFKELKAKFDAEVAKGTAVQFVEQKLDLKPGDEVITLAAGFPTTVNPIIQNGCVPVFIDIDIPTYNVNVKLLEGAVSSKTKAIIFAHTLGNPFDAAAVKQFALRHNLWLIEDCCDAVGAEFQGQRAGTFGDLATVSFYPAHHITMGEGGCVAAESGRQGARKSLPGQ